MTALQKYWLSAAKKHSLTIDVPFILEFSDGKSMTAEVRLQGYGADNGMLILSDYSLIQNRQDEIVKMGYGYSCFSQPSEEEIDYDEGITEILDDWGKTK